MMCKKCYGQWSWLDEHQWSYMIAMNTNRQWSVSYQGILCMICDHGWLFKWSCMISGDRCYEILLIISIFLSFCNFPHLGVYPGGVENCQKKHNPIVKFACGNVTRIAQFFQKIGFYFSKNHKNYKKNDLSHKKI